uniref:DUF19 domain-containing protein n=1 Tax=Macrostomum lignano TaxID=282301 RepID=A0A1I8H2T5_9PLAT
MSAAHAIAVLAIALAATRMCHAIRPYRSCTMAELEGIRRDCFYDFESKLSETPSRSIHVELHEKCNDSAIASYPVMRDCITVNLERRGCVTDEGLMRRFALTKKAHEHLCSVRHQGEYCRGLPKNLPHYVNLCIASLYDGIKKGVVCTRALMTVQKSQSCVHYILNLMGSQCYYLQFNFYHVRTYIEEQKRHRLPDQRHCFHYPLLQQ